MFGSDVNHTTGDYPAKETFLCIFSLDHSLEIGTDRCEPMTHWIAKSNSSDKTLFFPTLIRDLCVDLCVGVDKEDDPVKENFFLFLFHWAIAWKYLHIFVSQWFAIIRSEYAAEYSVPLNVIQKCDHG